MIRRLTHKATPDFWIAYNALPIPIQKVADKAFAQLKADPKHPSLHFKKVGGFWSARVGLHHRALGVDAPDCVFWFWIGTHPEYDRLVK